MSGLSALSVAPAAGASPRKLVKRLLLGLGFAFRLMHMVAVGQCLVCIDLLFDIHPGSLGSLELAAGTLDVAMLVLDGEIELQDELLLIPPLLHTDATLLVLQQPFAVFRPECLQLLQLEFGLLPFGPTRGHGLRSLLAALLAQLEKLLELKCACHDGRGRMMDSEISEY